MAKGKMVNFNLTLWGNKQSKIFAWIKAIIFIVIGLTYIFWTFDVIPDAIPVVGWIDDAIIFLLAAWAIRGAINTIMDKRATFLGKRK
jgi:uncharacterized membrane protein YkvA (DUF1232 family)